MFLCSVWRAIDKSTNKPLAVKKCFDSFRNNEDSQRTYREISYLKALKGHENIVQLLDHVVTEKDLYLLFDYVETDLHVVISHNILLPIHIQFIIYQLLKALKYIHSAGLLHRVSLFSLFSISFMMSFNDKNLCGFCWVKFEGHQTI
jgi:mitogen-activated protein kinase 15